MYSNPSHPNEYKDWQLRAPTVDEGQAKLPSSLKGLLRHIRNVWEHRAEKAHTITGAPQLPPSMAQVMNYFEDHFPTVVDDAWKVAQCTVAGSEFLRGGFPIPRTVENAKRRRVSSSADEDNELMILFKKKRQWMSSAFSESCAKCSQQIC